MKVRTEDYWEILSYLVNKRWGGEEFVAYCNDGMPVDKEQLYFFTVRKKQWNSAMKWQRI